jgi:predicted nucleotide-binding protein (sugar kinase/HSP70/actin superfamily)
MKKYLISLALPLISGLTLAAPSASAPALAILAQSSALCYSADVTVNDKTDAALSKQAEAIMLKTLNGLALSAKQYDAADTCDRELIFNFNVDNAGAPTIYIDSLRLETYNATDGSIQLKDASVWRSSYWGGDAKVYSAATFTKKMQDNLVSMLGEFTTDYHSIIK